MLVHRYGTAKDDASLERNWISATTTWSSMPQQIVAKSIRRSRWETATWLRAHQLNWWVKERQEWWGRVRGADGCQRCVQAADLRQAEVGGQPWLSLSFVVGRAITNGESD
jgi:RimJ/RimL family protein N-acetyltransferase